MNESSHPSPDGNHEIVLIYDGEIPHGPAYSSAALDGRSLGDRLFGKPVLWSADSRYVVLQQWNSAVPSGGPDTTLFVVRLKDYGYDDTAQMYGFMEPKRFEGSVLHYEQNRYGLVEGDRGFGVGRVNHAVSEVDLDPLTGWRPLFPTAPSE